jgi:hypothetical protein
VIVEPLLDHPAEGGVPERVQRHVTRPDARPEHCPGEEMPGAVRRVAIQGLAFVKT